MKVSVFGLGYVGAVTSACLAESGYEVLGVDRDKLKVDLINKGRTPIIEKDLERLISENVRSGRLKATTDPIEAIQKSEIALISVGTPSEKSGNINLRFIERVCMEIGSAIKSKDEYFIVVIRSTVLPGTVINKVIPTLEEHSGKKVGRDFGIAINPEFLRESTAVYDFYNPPKTVIGVLDEKDSRKISKLYKDIEAPLIITSIQSAEMIKYSDNVFHALKVTFANEIGKICKSIGIDSHDVMDIFCEDKKLNLSSYYLKPGFAFGGSCLPKDLRALNYLGRHKDLDLPLLNSIMPSNTAHIQHALQLIEEKEKYKIGILGFAFKAGTDDLRESPIVTLIETLLGKGFEIKIYDESVNLSFLTGANRKFIEDRIPHLAALMATDIDDILSFSELVVIGNKNERFREIISKIRPGQHILDLVRIQEETDTLNNYEGICW